MAASRGGRYTPERSSASISSSSSDWVRSSTRFDGLGRNASGSAGAHRDRGSCVSLAPQQGHEEGERGGRTVEHVLLVLCALVVKLVCLAHELLDLVLELELEGGDLLEDDAELDELVDDGGGAVRGGEGAAGELEGEEGDEVLQVRDEEVVLEREERDALRVAQVGRGGEARRRVGGDGGQQASKT